MLQTHDMPGTKAWYAEILGFAVQGEYKGQWCSLGCDRISIMFMHNDHFGAPQATAVQCFIVDDVNALWASIKDRCKAEWGPEDMHYGLREFAIKDPNGYLLSFASEIECAPTE